jgi:hypothetical protein
MRRLTRLALFAATFVLAACAGSATTGGGGQIDPGSLVGMRGSSMDMELTGKGFTSAGGYKTGDTSSTIWWNERARQCIRVDTRDGRVADAETIFEGNCL